MPFKSELCTFRHSEIHLSAICTLVNYKAMMSSSGCLHALTELLGLALASISSDVGRFCLHWYASSSFASVVG